MHESFKTIVKHAADDPALAFIHWPPIDGVPQVCLEQSTVKCNVGIGNSVTKAIQ